MAALLLSLSAKGVAVFALGAAVAALLRRSSASVRHGVWAATFAAALAVPALDAIGPSWGVPVLPAGPVSALPSVEPGVALAGLSGALPSGPPVSSMGEGTGMGLAAWLVGLWPLGVAAVAARWLRAYARGRRLVRASRVVDDGVWTARVRDAASAVGVAGPVRLRVSDALAVPVAWGWGRPTVLLPARSGAWGEERARAVLAHEIAHLRRRDAWTQALAQAALAVHWPNPLAWAAYRRLRAEREQACDDAVLASGASPPSYAAHLVAVAREIRAARPAPAVLAALVAPDELEARVRAVLDDRRRRGRAGRGATRAAVGLAVVLGTPLAAVHPVASQRPPETPPRPDAVEAEEPLDQPEPAVAAIAPTSSVAAGSGDDQPSARSRRDEFTRPSANDGVYRRDTTDADETQLQHEASAVEREAASVEREAARVEREAAQARREGHTVEREVASVQREVARLARATAALEREAERVEREAARVEREAARLAREAAQAERGPPEPPPGPPEPPPALGL